MRIVIAGAGEVGYNIAKELAEDYDVTVIESDLSKAQEVDKLNVEVVMGNAANVAVLKRASIESADLFLAVTGNDEINLLSALAAKKLGVKTVIVRVDKPEYADKPVIRNHPVGYDVLVCPNLVLASYLARLVTIPGSVEFAELEDAILVEMAVREDSLLAGKTIADAGFPKNVIVAAIHRKGKILLPRGNTEILPGDILAVFGKKEEIQVLRGVIGEPVVRNVFIVGAGEIGVYTAKILEKSNLNIKMIDLDESIAERAKKELKRTKVIVGNATDIDLLMEEEIDKADIAIVATESDEKNLLIALLAKSLGAKKAFVKVDKKEYIPLFEKVGVDAAVSPRRATYLEVMKLLRLMDIRAIGEVKEGVVVLEIESGIDGKKVSEIKLPESTIIVAIRREGEIEIAKGDTEISRGDLVYIITTWENVEKVKKRLMA
ncbi:Trk system potassium transporter TrkA [Geoglobus acetivorans]|nr:Trk system potassium transporter TrkA [Geoglobus acetivorans]